jgi:4a-hydroxytetrahydrobiopterin dehydratase
MPELLDPQHLEDALKELDGWKLDDKEISRTFEFEDFNEALGFVTRVGLKAERMFHHPDIDIRWNKVTLTLSTHSEGGVTDMDIAMAKFCDEVVG